MAAIMRRKTRHQQADSSLCAAFTVTSAAAAAAVRDVDYWGWRWYEQ